MTRPPLGLDVRTALVVVAHPDDEVLLCGGTVVELVRAGTAVHVACLSTGAQGRDEALAKSCTVLGATHELRDFPTNQVRVDGSLVSTTDELVEAHRPDVVVTHGPGLGQSQDHRAVHDAVRTTVSRSPWPRLLLLGEPPFCTTDSTPSLFVDVTQAWDTRMDALEHYRRVLDRDYMHPDYLRTKAAWWAQVAGRASMLCEGFAVGLWRPALHE
jgi:N-acetylglucosamine malate deacetylase 1